MGAGKSTVGRELAEAVGLPFVDTDGLIEERAGKSIAQIFAESGERGFRAIESDVVLDALDGPESVVALGGGALGDPLIWATLESHRVVHLDVSIDEALKRI